MHRQFEALRIGLRHGQRVRAVVQRVHLPQAALVLQRQRDCAAAGAQVQHPLRCGGQGLQRPIDQGLGVCAGVEHAGVYQQVQTVKSLVPGDVSQGFATEPPF